LAPTLPIDEWPGGEEEYWIMWRDNGEEDSTVFASNLWKEAINSIYGEILVKSLVNKYRRIGREYWDYSQKMINSNLRRGDEINVVLSIYESPEIKDLVKRWLRLGIEVAI
jgi:hypothetical protein